MNKLKSLKAIRNIFGYNPDEASKIFNFENIREYLAFEVKQKNLTENKSLNLYKQFANYQDNSILQNDNLPIFTTNEVVKNEYFQKELSNHLINKIVNFVDYKLEIEEEKNQSFKKKKRNLEIFFKKLEGEKDSILTKEYNLSRSAIKQIYSQTLKQVFIKNRYIFFNFTQKNNSTTDYKKKYKKKCIKN